MRNNSKKLLVPASKDGSGVDSGVEDVRRNRPDWALRIKKKREEVGLTQEELAKKVDVSKTAIQNWETGKNRPAGNNLKALAVVLDCTTDWMLFGGEPEILASEVVRYPGQKGKRIASHVTYPMPLEYSGKFENAFNVDLLKNIIEWVEEREIAEPLDLSTEKKARLIALMYDRFFKTGEVLDEKIMVNYLRLVS
jgi:transcriptional regulator with XRE-family HTH domain